MCWFGSFVSLIWGIFLLHGIIVRVHPHRGENKLLGLVLLEVGWKHKAMTATLKAEASLSAITVVTRSPFSASAQYQTSMFPWYFQRLLLINSVNNHINKFFLLQRSLAQSSDSFSFIECLNWCKHALVSFYASVAKTVMKKTWNPISNDSCIAFPAKLNCLRLRLALFKSRDWHPLQLLIVSLGESSFMVFEWVNYC